MKKKGCRMQDAGYLISDIGYRISDIATRIPYPVSRIPHPASCIFYLVLCFFATGSIAQTSSYDAVVGIYIKAYSPIAVLEMNQFHIPASITLAQGIIESGAGLSKLAAEANNHFGIKCHKDWTGKTYHRTDDHIDECFRKYDHPEESFRDHSVFLTQRDRYKGLFLLPVTDYRAWAEGLQKAGYATNPQYAERLVHTIEQYQLYLFDKPDYLPGTIAAANPDFTRYPWIATFTPAGFANDGRTIYKNNELKCIIARNTDTMSTLSDLLDVPAKRLMKYNDLKFPGSLEAGQVVYFEPKKRKASVDFHIVRAGETLYEISQRYGIKMKLLLKRSGMSSGIEPYPGQALPLR
ncbi:MAG: glucosaminidase domain-containing protein [Bacteroidetes bacterium]|nr:glucosaminidase domain-containing protein [Bacteroidota bacterium]